MTARSIFVDLVAIACWIVLWVGTVTVGLKLGLMMVGPEGRDGYGAATGLAGILVISPLGLLCSTFFLWVKRRVAIFVSCGALVAITLWPLLGWIFPWLTW